MSAAIEILAPNHQDRVKKAIKGVEKARVVEKLSDSTQDFARILVGFVSDLDTPQGRRSLVNMVDLVVKNRKGTPFVLVQQTRAKRIKPNPKRLELVALWAQQVDGFYLAPSTDAIRRMVLARRAGAESKLMASASIGDGLLTVWSCEPKRYEVAVSKIPALAELKTRDLESFTLSKSGTRLHWDKGDVDLGLDSILYYADDKFRKVRDKSRREDAARYAGAIKALRQSLGLSQSDIDGLSAKQVGRIERGECVPQSATLAKLAEAHEMNLAQYLNELAAHSKTA